MLSDMPVIPVLWQEVATSIESIVAISISIGNLVSASFLRVNWRPWSHTEGTSCTNHTRDAKPKLIYGMMGAAIAQ